MEIGKATSAIVEGIRDGARYASASDEGRQEMIDNAIETFHKSVIAVSASAASGNPSTRSGGFQNPANFATPRPTAPVPAPVSGLSNSSTTPPPAGPAVGLGVSTSKQGQGYMSWNP
jgi:hypothetical protein